MNELQKYLQTARQILKDLDLFNSKHRTGEV